jgi:hypothetical protein
MEPEQSIGAYVGTVSLALSVLLFGCGQETEGAERWSLEERDLEPIVQGLYDVSVEIERDQCGEPSLGEIVESNPDWPPRQSGVWVITGDSRLASVSMYAYNLRLVGDINMAFDVLSDATPMGRHLTDRTISRTGPDTAGGPCRPAIEATYPVYDAHATARLNENGTIEVPVEIEWKGLAECSQSEEMIREKFPWLPREMPCRESYTLTYEPARSCGSIEQCRVTKNNLPNPGKPNEGYDYQCECDDPSTDAGRRTEE